MASLNARMKYSAAATVKPFSAGTSTSLKYFGSIASKSNDTTKGLLPIALRISWTVLRHSDSDFNCSGVRMYMLFARANSISAGSYDRVPR